MKLIIGLGNIGTQYQNTRHNLGFMVLDAFAEVHGLPWLKKDKFKAMVAEGVVEGQKVVLVKPNTLYNLSGDAAMAVASFYKIPPQHIAIVHDELALPFGAIRLRFGGSDAGNNGLKSIIAAFGPDFARIRIGIANEQLAASDAANFVLSRFSAEEQQKLSAIQKHAMEQLGAFVQDNFNHTTVKV